MNPKSLWKELKSAILNKPLDPFTWSRKNVYV